MLYPEYVWITYDSYHDDWWAVNTKCDPSDMKHMMNGSLTIIPEEYYPLLNGSYTHTISGLVRCTCSIIDIPSHSLLHYSTVPMLMSVNTATLTNQ